MISAHVASILKHAIYEKESISYSTIPHNRYEQIMASPVAPSESLVIIDGSYFLYRAFYGLRPLTAPDGTSVGALFGFCRMLKKIVETRKPTHLCIAWDSPTPTQRTAVYNAYKAHRQETPSELNHQRMRIQELVAAMHIAQYSADGYEADDILYTLCRRYRGQIGEIILVTADKDMAQLVDDRTFMYDAFTETLMGPAGVIAKFGIPPDRMHLYLALLGDTSDNIPGVRGIGPKAARTLATAYATMDDLYGAIATITPASVKKRLEDDRENAQISYQLIELKEVPLPLAPADLPFNPTQWQLARPLFQRWGFVSLLKEIPVSPQEQPRTEPFAQQYGYTFLLVQTADALTAVCDAIRSAQRCAIDTETTGGSVVDTTIVGISIATEVGHAWYIPLNHSSAEPQLPINEVIAQLKPVLEDPRLEIICHNGQYDRLVMASIGITLQVSFDTLIAAGLTTTNEHERINLKSLSERILQQKMYSFKEIMGAGTYATFAEVPVDRALDYAAADAHQTLQLAPYLTQRLAQENETTLFKTIEMPLMPILARMTQRGIPVDREELLRSGTAINDELQAVEATIRTMAGAAADGINLNAPRQIETLLFEHLKLPPLKKTASGGYSTDAEVLEVLAREYPIAQLLISYRTLFKIKSTYIDTLPTYSNRTTGRIHASFSQTATATGRLSCSEPNLQNIPVDRYSGHSIRQAFKAPPGMLLISADYSQIELRVLAFLSGDTTLIRAFLHNEDIHATTAAKLYGVAVDAVTHEQRQRGKRINFSILYGLTPYGLSRELMIPLKEAKEAIDTYFQHYPQVALWMDSVIARAKEQGYVTTQWGRRRYVPGIYEKNKNLYDLACRVAVNTVAQGTAAEIMKLGMIALEKQYTQTGNGAEMLLQIHDELIIAAPAADAEQIAQETKSILERVVSWPVPLLVTTRIGLDWDAVTK